MLSRALKMAFWVMYDHLGILMVANLVWSVAVLVPGFFGFAALLTGDPGLILFMGAPLLVLALGILMPVVSAGMAHMIKGLVETHDGSLSDLFGGMRLYWRRAVGIGLAYVAACTALPVSVWFYATRLKDAAPWLGFAISAIAAWCLLFVLLTGMLVIPALVQKKAGLRDTLKLAALLVLDNPLFSVGLAVQCVMLGSLAIIPPVLVLFSASAQVALVSCGYEMLARKYAAVRVSQGLPPNTDRPIHVVSRNGKLRFEDEEDDYLNRGLRDFLFHGKADSR